MAIIKGKLTLKFDNDDYLMFTGGRSENISDLLHILYTEKAEVCIDVKNAHSGKTLFQATGELSKMKLQPKYYTYCIVQNGIEKDLDSVLWNNVGGQVEISIKNVGKK